MSATKEPCAAQYYDLERSHDGDGHRCGRMRGHAPESDHKCGVGACRAEWESFEWAKPYDSAAGLSQELGRF